MIEIDGEPIIRRTVRLLWEQHQISPEVFTPHQQIIDVIQPYAGFTRTEVAGPSDVLMDSCFFTNEDNIVLLGDVYYSEKALRTILEEPPTKFFLRFGPQGKHHPIGGEIFALSIAESDLDAFIDLKNYFVNRNYDHHISFWHFYRAWNNEGIYNHQIFDNHVIIDDETDDFDHPGEFEKWLKKNRKRGRRA